MSEGLQYTLKGTAKMTPERFVATHFAGTDIFDALEEAAKFTQGYAFPDDGTESIPPEIAETARKQLAFWEQVSELLAARLQQEQPAALESLRQEAAP